MNTPLQGRVAAVTGAASGIGRASAEAMRETIRRHIVTDFA